MTGEAAPRTAAEERDIGAAQKARCRRNLRAATLKSAIRAPDTTVARSGGVAQRSVGQGSRGGTARAGARKLAIDRVRSKEVQSNWMENHPLFSPKRRLAIFPCNDVLEVMQYISPKVGQVAVEYEQGLRSFL